MLVSLSQRLLTLLQLTRMALVFTAIADGLCTLLLAARVRAGPGGDIADHISAGQVFWAAAVSAGLYGFGMSLNDIIDRRRDAQIAATRPLPSGRMGVAAAHGVCVALVATAIAAGAWYSVLSRGTSTGDFPTDWMPLVLVLWTGLLV